MIHHFKPAVTSIAAVPLRRENVPDLIQLLHGPVGDPHADRFDVEPDGSVVVHGIENDPIRYGARSDPQTWWLMVDNAGSIWFTATDPYDDDDYIPAERAR